MYTCGNCGNEFNDTEDGFVVHHKGTLASAICPTCTDGAKVVKLVMRRGPANHFKYDQYSALEMQGKAFGR